MGRIDNYKNKSLEQPFLDYTLRYGPSQKVRDLRQSRRLEYRESLKAVGALRAESQAPKKRKSFLICHLPFSIFHLKRRGLGDGLKS
jgi:hypothetical protein